jgi:hypothetical protein
MNLLPVTIGAGIGLLPITFVVIVNPSERIFGFSMRVVVLVREPNICSRSTLSLI